MEQIMKKVLRVLVPIILALAIVLCLAWYLFIYDQEFTRDMLLSGARHFEAAGNHQVAAWFYDCAYRQAEDNDAVAIELAEQHKAAGNYTQAEYTLSHAIADGGGVDLYIALCKTYVEQDKLLDAVTMLDTVSNTEIKAQLDAMRPSAPTTQAEPGFYSQYISVDISSSAGTLYVTADGTYPSISDAPYAEPVTLVDGENTLYAISVAENGLVSPLSIFGYTVGGVIEKLEFSDRAIAEAVHAMLNLPENKELYTNDLWTITSFTVPADAKSLEDLHHFTYLEELTINAGAPDQLSYISGLAELVKLTVTGTSVSPEELKIIGNLPMLEELVLSGCGLTTTTGLENAEKLKVLDLSDNTLRNIDVIANMPALQTLYLQNNTVTDLSALSSCKDLRKLDVSHNALTSLSPIGTLTDLYWVNAADNAITEISQLRNLTDLTHLSLAANQITDISALAACTELMELNLSDNAITSILVLEDHMELTHLDFSHNQVTELPAWSKDIALIEINGSYNQLTTLAPLAGLQSLNSIYMDYNAEITSVEELASCPVLVLVNVYGTKVEEIGALTKLSIVVNYDPTV